MHGFEDDTETVEVHTMSLDGGAALEAVNRAEVDIQIATAHRFPRSIRTFKTQAMELATLDEDTAASMFYNLPRGGKRIEGPSVRLAEVVASTWGNLRVEARVASIDERYVTAVGTAMDLEKNYAARSEVKRRITNKSGKRFDDDMIQVTCNAACSIAMREAVFKVVPRALIKDIYEAAKQTSVGKAMSIQQRRHRALEWCAKVGVDEGRVLASLGRKGIEEVTIDDLITLTGIKTAIQDGEITIEAAFATEEERAAPSAAAQDLNERLRQARASNSRPAQPAPAAEPQPPTHQELDNVGLTGEVAHEEPQPEPEGGPAQDPVSDFLEMIWGEPGGRGKATDVDRQKVRLAARVLREPDDAARADWYAQHEALGKTEGARAAELAQAVIDLQAPPAGAAGDDLFGEG